MPCWGKIKQKAGTAAAVAGFVTRRFAHLGNLTHGVLLSRSH